jgi:hypothetical protein
MKINRRFGGMIDKQGFVIAHIICINFRIYFNQTQNTLLIFFVDMRRYNCFYVHRRSVCLLACPSVWTYSYELIRFIIHVMKSYNTLLHVDI